ncbi:hypothetical protein BH24ACT15_BH24ACT15_34670 [soil metagenome]
MNRSRLAFGILLIVAGGLWVIDALQWWETGDVVARWWPLFLVAVGGIRMLDRPPDYVGGVAMMLIAVVLLDGTADVWPGNVAELIWPLILVGIGLTLIVHRRHSNLWSREDVMQLTAIFSGRRAVCSADPFRGAVAVAVFGGVDIDLRPAVIGPEGAFVDATAAFGGVNLIVPPDWRVVMSGPAIFGGNENKTELLVPLPRTAPVLNVRALRSLAESKSRPSRTAHSHRTWWWPWAVPLHRRNSDDKHQASC